MMTAMPKKPPKPKKRADVWRRSDGESDPVWFMESYGSAIADWIAKERGQGHRLIKCLPGDDPRRVRHSIYRVFNSSRRSPLPATHRLRVACYPGAVLLDCIPRGGET